VEEVSTNFIINPIEIVLNGPVNYINKEHPDIIPMFGNDYTYLFLNTPHLSYKGYELGEFDSIIIP
jgi:hypothetical protein